MRTPLLSLDELRERMVKWKRDEISAASRQLDTVSRQASAARAACALVVEQRPSQLGVCNAVGALLVGALQTPRWRACAPLEERTSVGQWRCITAERGAYLEHRPRAARKWAAELSEEGARHFLDTTNAWLVGSNATDARKARDEIARAQRELTFFREELRRIAAPAAGGPGGSGSDADASATCVICLEVPESDVGVLPCGHCAGCATCVRAWVVQSGVCPTCRRPARLHDVSFVSLAAAPQPGELASSAAAEHSPAAAPAAATTDVDPEEAARWGTKPAAIVAHLRGVLSNAGSRAIVFSSFDTCLALLASTFEDAGVLAVRCEGDAAARHAAISAFDGTAPPARPPPGQPPTAPPRVLLLSSKYNASGTNLQCADHVIFVEPPGTNPRDSLSIETQAIGRTLRLGQTRQVKVRCFLMDTNLPTL